MDLEAFNKLEDTEKAAYFDTVTSQEKDIKNKDAEIASLKKELESVQNSLSISEKELSDTKELNYTLARRVDISKDRKSFEETLHAAFGKEK